MTTLLEVEQERASRCAADARGKLSRNTAVRAMFSGVAFLLNGK